MIRPMTSNEIRKALRHGAQACIYLYSPDWRWYDVLPADDAFSAAAEWVDGKTDPTDGVTLDYAHAANFLLLVAEAHE